jgi:hypothetical protein
MGSDPHFLKPSLLCINDLKDALDAYLGAEILIDIAVALSKP